MHPSPQSSDEGSRRPERARTEPADHSAEPDDQLIGRDRSCCGRLVLHGGRLQRCSRLADRAAAIGFCPSACPNLPAGKGRRRADAASVCARRRAAPRGGSGRPARARAGPDAGEPRRPSVSCSCTPSRKQSPRRCDPSSPRRCELLPREGIERALLNLFLRLRDGRARAALVAERVADELPEVEPSGTDAQEHETAGEDNDEKDERPLRLIAQAGEEHRVLGYARGAATGFAAGWASMARLALCAAAVSSCQSIPPFS